jgi:hypothetical protein
MVMFWKRGLEIFLPQFADVDTRRSTTSGIEFMLHIIFKSLGVGHSASCTYMNGGHGLVLGENTEDWA